MQGDLFMNNIKKTIEKFKRKESKKIDIENVSVGEVAVINDPELDVHINEGVFLSSLHFLTANDIELNETAKNVKKPKPDLLKYAILLICAGIFLYSGYNVVQTLVGYVQARQNYQEIRNIFYDTEVVSTDLSKLQMPRPVRPLQDLLSSQRQTEVQVVEAEYSDKVSAVVQTGVQLDILTAYNPDTYGWIKVKCPLDERINRIDYVIVQSADNDYYLDHNFFGNPQKAGAIYGDFRISRNVDDNLNTIIYGHNMGDQSMFGPLLYFGGSVDKFNMGTIEISTWDGIYIYEIFSVYETYADSRGFQYSYIMTDFESERQYLEFLEELKDRSKFPKDVKFTSGSRIVTLSTCTNNWRNTRFAVHGVLVNIIR